MTGERKLKHNRAQDVTPEAVVAFLPPNTLADNLIQNVHIMLDRNDGKAKDYLVSLANNTFRLVARLTKRTSSSSAETDKPRLKCCAVVKMGCWVSLPALVLSLSPCLPMLP